MLFLFCFISVKEWFTDGTIRNGPSVTQLSPTDPLILLFFPLTFLHSKRQGHSEYIRVKFLYQ